MSLYSKLGYDLEKDLVPVTLVANVPHILVAHSSVPGKTLGDVIAYLKAQGNKVNFASQGNGTLSHLQCGFNYFNPHGHEGSKETRHTIGIVRGRRPASTS